MTPGFGFVKPWNINYEILARLNGFQSLNLPVLAGISRKSMLYKLLESTPDDMLNATSVANTIALVKGASILRVHDVKPAVEAVKIVSLTRKFQK